MQRACIFISVLILEMFIIYIFRLHFLSNIHILCYYLPVLIMFLCYSFNYSNFQYLKYYNFLLDLKILFISIFYLVLLPASGSEHWTFIYFINFFCLNFPFIILFLFYLILIFYFLLLYYRPAAAR